MRFDSSGRVKTKLLRYCATLAAASFLSSCGLVDSGVEWRGGPYELIWIDSPDNLQLCRREDETGCIGEIDAMVFAVGWDGHYAIAKQHPGGDMSRTNYYIMESQKKPRDDVVIGPLTVQEFENKSVKLGLPKFSKVIESLQ